MPSWVKAMKGTVMINGETTQKYQVCDTIDVFDLISKNTRHAERCLDLWLSEDISGRSYKLLSFIARKCMKIPCQAFRCCGTILTRSEVQQAIRGYKDGNALSRDLAILERIGAITWYRGNRTHKGKHMIPPVVIINPPPGKADCIKDENWKQYRPSVNNDGMEEFYDGTVAEAPPY